MGKKHKGKRSNKRTLKQIEGYDAPRKRGKNTIERWLDKSKKLIMQLQ